MGTGGWNLISGNGGFDHPSPSAGYIQNILTWMTTHSLLVDFQWCMSLSADTISIINYALPDDAIAGDDLFLCDTFSILNAAPVIKVESWSIIDLESLKTLIKQSNLT